MRFLLEATPWLPVAAAKIITSLFHLVYCSESWFCRQESVSGVANIMEIVYVYTKKRSEFGRQPLFSDLGAQLHVDIEPDDSLKENFIDKNPVDMALQYAPEMSEHEVN